jgi:DNA-binding protein Fis
LQGKGSTTKKRQSDIQGRADDIKSQVAAFSTEVDSVRSSMLKFKNERYAAKLAAHDQAEHRRMIHDHLSNELANAALTHKRNEESKASDIRLQEVEAETLRLKIEYYKLTNSSTGSSDQSSGP